MATSKSKLSLSPQHVDTDTWYYEEEQGIEIVHQFLDSHGEVATTVRFAIPWGKLRKSVARKYGSLK